MCLVSIRLAIAGVAVMPGLDGELGLLGLDRRFRNLPPPPRTPAPRRGQRGATWPMRARFAAAGALRI
jgi:hypothetical protein